MSYTLKVSTDFYVPLNYHRPPTESSSIHRNMPATFTKQSNFRLIVPGIGELTILDLKDRKITNLPFIKQTWGLLICYQGQECEFRYEGEGEVKINVNDLGQIELDGNGTFLMTDLPSFIVKKK